MGFEILQIYILLLLLAMRHMHATHDDVTNMHGCHCHVFWLQTYVAFQKVFEFNWKRSTLHKLAKK